MIPFFKKLFSSADVPDYASLTDHSNAIILDVRTREEYKGGSIAGSVNIPLTELEQGISKLKDKSRPVICCCASGMRSGRARNILIKKGFERVYNAGGWQQLQSQLSR